MIGWHGYGWVAVALGMLASPCCAAGGAEPVAAPALDAPDGPDISSSRPAVRPEGDPALRPAQAVSSFQPRPAEPAPAWSAPTSRFIPRAPLPSIGSRTQPDSFPDPVAIDARAVPIVTSVPSPAPAPAIARSVPLVPSPAPSPPLPILSPPAPIRPAPAVVVRPAPLVGSDTPPVMPPIPTPALRRPAFAPPPPPGVANTEPELPAPRTVDLSGPSPARPSSSTIPPGVCPIDRRDELLARCEAAWQRWDSLHETTGSEGSAAPGRRAAPVMPNLPDEPTPGPARPGRLP